MVKPFQAFIVLWLEYHTLATDGVGVCVWGEGTKALSTLHAWSYGREEGREMSWQKQAAGTLGGDDIAHVTGSF